MKRKENLIRITVIVTVHNAENYLRECLDSVIGQTLPDIEILCMDGGSTDASPQILKEYSAMDSRIRIINDTNTSYGHKVNEGIRQARGEYISVLESDDMYQPDMLEKLYAVAEKYHPDYVNADYLSFFDIDGKRFQALVKMYEKEDYGKLLESGKHPENMRRILRYWTGIFRKSFLVQKEIRMNESPGASFQDMSFRFLTSALADTCYHLEEPVYLYRTDNPGSSVYDPKKAVVIADEYDFLKKELEIKKVDDPHIWKHFYTWKYKDFYGNLVRFQKDARQALLERCCMELEKEKVQLEKYAETDTQVTALWTEKPLGEITGIIEADYQRQQANMAQKTALYRWLGDFPLIIFGCGRRGKSVFANLYSVREQICCFTDNNEELWHTERDGVRVLSPVEAIKQYPNANYIVANKNNSNEIKNQLLKNGIEETHIFVF